MPHSVAVVDEATQGGVGPSKPSLNATTGDPPAGHMAGSICVM